MDVNYLISAALIIFGFGILITYFKKSKNSPQEKLPTKEDNAKIEAMKQQIQSDMFATANQPETSSNHPSVISDSLGHPDEQSVIVTNEKKLPAKEQKVININIEPDEIKSQAASEVIDIPKGVTIRVKRTRTVEHTISIEWSATIAGKGEIGIKQLVSASIQGEIQRVKGYESQQSETMEYEVTLDGDKHTQYKLIWMDVWLKGIAEIQDGNINHQQLFQFRDRAELKVVPVYT